MGNAGVCPIPIQADAASRQGHPIAAASLTLLILHSLPSYCSPHSSSLLSNISPSSPPECSPSRSGDWRQVASRERLLLCSSINFVICVLRLQCMDLCTISVRTFLFSVFLDLCMINVRVCGMASSGEREQISIQLCSDRTPSAPPSNPLDSPHSSWIYQNPREGVIRRLKNTRRKQLD